MSRRKTTSQILFERDIEMWFAAADVMSVIRSARISDVWQESLMSAHFQMVYHYAHLENERIDDAIKNGSWWKNGANVVASIKGIKRCEGAQIA
jgi:hypothetical protein